MNSNTTNLQSHWINSKSYDLAFIFGGSIFTLMLPLLAAQSPLSLIPLFFWGWVFFFEGSHFWATYSRTFMDFKFMKENRGDLFFSLLFLVLPACMVGISSMTQNPLAMNLYGFFIFSWSLYHNTRQHYGFVSIYNRKANASQKTMELFRWGMYLTSYAPMAHFFLSYKLGADFPGFFGTLSSYPWFNSIVLNLPMVLSGVSLLYFGYLTARILSQKPQSGSPISLLYIFNCFIFYNVMFYLVAAKGPFFPGYENFGQKLMVVSIMNSLFHNIQYHAMVWFYSKKRYAETPSEGFFGWAKAVNSKFKTYALASLTFSVLFTMVFWLRAEIPFFGSGVSDGTWSKLAYAVYFGVVGHHFFLDQKIWRVSKAPELSQYLSLNFNWSSKRAA
jgi:hypothetical protein